MELQTLKELFFQGEAEAINAFCSELKPRCLRETEIMDVDDIPTLLLIYTVNGETSYIDPYMNVYKRCTHCGKLRLIDKVKTVTIEESQRWLGVDLRHRVKTEDICEDCLAAQDYLVPEIGSEFYVRIDDSRTVKVTYADGRVGWVHNMQAVPDGCVSIYRATTYNGNRLVKDPSNVYETTLCCPVLAKVSRHGARTVYVLQSEMDDHPDWFAQCSECARWCFAKDLVNGRCALCSSVEIYRYHRWPGHLEFKKLDSEEDVKMFFGIEIETEGSEDNKECVANYQDVWHLEHDSSLNDGGFEMISQPMSWGFIKSEYLHFKALFASLTEAGQISDRSDRCGLHIHVSKVAFKSESAINRCLAIVHGMSDEMQRFGRRFHCSYAEFSNIPPMPSEDDLNRIERTGHSVAVNLDTSSFDGRSADTIEFRFPKGSLNILTVMATIEFIKNVVELANSDKNVVKFGDLIYGDYVPDYIRAREQYRNIYFDTEVKVNFSRFTIEGPLYRVVRNNADETALTELLSALSSITGRTITMEGGAA